MGGFAPSRLRGMGSGKLRKHSGIGISLFSDKQPSPFSSGSVIGPDRRVAAAAAPAFRLASAVGSFLGMLCT
jgi:hypothetical protein